MKKFEEEFDKNIDVFHVIGCHNGMCCSVKEVKVFGKDWVSPEDHQQVAKALVNTTDKLDCAEERVGLLEKTVNQLKSQLEKQQPEIPEFVAEFITKLKKANNNLTFVFSSRVNECPAKYWNEAILWLFTNPEEFAQAWINGYTVETPKVIVTPCPVCGYEEVESNFCSICGRKNDYE